MNLFLTRKQRRLDGIFSDLRDPSDTLIAQTLEHSYIVADGEFEPKIPNGSYTCVRGQHRLHNMAEDFETFEITGVSGHENLLFHWGNYNKDSEGCVLLGKHIERAPDQSQMVTESRAAFASFMTLQAGVSEFTLTVE